MFLLENGECGGASDGFRAERKVQDCVYGGAQSGRVGPAHDGFVGHVGEFEMDYLWGGEPVELVDSVG